MTSHPQLIIEVWDLTGGKPPKNPEKTPFWDGDPIKKRKTCVQSIVSIGEGGCDKAR